RGALALPESPRGRRARVTLRSRHADLAGQAEIRARVAVGRAAIRVARTAPKADPVRREVQPRVADAASGAVVRREVAELGAVAVRPVRARQADRVVAVRGAVGVGGARQAGRGDARDTLGLRLAACWIVTIDVAVKVVVDEIPTRRLRLDPREVEGER